MTFRTFSLTSGIISHAISTATQLKNAGNETGDISNATFEAVREGLRTMTTQELFYAAGKILNDVTLSDAKGSLQDFIITELARIVTNDVLNSVFRKADEGQRALHVERERASLAFPLIDKKVVKKQAIGPISDALRDEMSGANVTAGAGDNDCGDACRI